MSTREMTLHNLLNKQDWFVFCKTEAQFMNVIKVLAENAINKAETMDDLMTDKTFQFAYRRSDSPSLQRLDSTCFGIVSDNPYLDDEIPSHLRMIEAESLLS